MDIQKPMVSTNKYIESASGWPSYCWGNLRAFWGSVGVFLYQVKDIIDNDKAIMDEYKKLTKYGSLQKKLIPLYKLELHGCIKRR